MYYADHKVSTISEREYQYILLSVDKEKKYFYIKILCTESKEKIG